MAFHHTRSGPPTSAEAIWHARRVQQLETDSSLMKEQLSAVALKNANNLLLLSQVYNVTLHPIGSDDKVACIKQLIEEGAKSIMTAANGASGSLPSTEGGQTMTPPSTGPPSELSVNLNSEESNASDGPEDDNVDLLGHSSSSATVTTKKAATKVTVPPKDIKKLAEQSPELPAKPIVKQQPKQLHSLATQRHLKQQARHQAKGLARARQQDPVKTEHASGQLANGAAQTDTAENIWQEFSLEEELEGIADAPAMSRAALRADLRGKEEANRKRMRESADEKRRIAENEGHILKQTLLRPVDATTDVEIPRHFEYHKQASSNINVAENKTKGYYAVPIAAPEAGAPVASHLANKKTPRLAERARLRRQIVDAESEIDGERPMPMFYYQQPFSRRPKWFSNRAMTEMYQSSGMINVEYGSPKNADRFGIVFNPSKLDAEKVAEVTGTRNGNDNRRSVLIQNIPPEFSLHKLLAHVRGGDVITARLVPDTMGPGHGQVAMITFKTAEEAANCKEITSGLLAYSEKMEGFPPSAETKMAISLLPTPTYPSRETIDSAGSANTGLAAEEEKTRCVVVDNFPKEFIHDLCVELLLGTHGFPSKMNVLEEMWFAGDDLHMQFANIQEADKAHRIASIFHFEKYATQVRFGPDPCAAKIDLNRINFASLFDDNGIKLASHGYLGLKPLLETVGLASFSRSHAKAAAAAMPAFTGKKVAPSAVSKMNFSALLSTAREVTQNQNGGSRPSSSRVSKYAKPPQQAYSQAQTSSEKFVNNNHTLIDLSFDVTPDSSIHSSTAATPFWDGLMSRSIGAPWTQDLMTGLDNW